MKFFDFAFKLGVVFAVFSFIWGIIRIAISFLRPKGAEKSIVEEYSIKLIQYFFLADVTFLFCLDEVNNNQVLYSELIIAGAILFMYFIGKLQKKQQRLVMFQGFKTSLNGLIPKFDLKAEIGVIIFAMTTFIFLFFKPVFATNPISVWFFKNITEIEKAPFFGWIFNLIGFFVLLSIMNKLINGVFYLLSGKPLFQTSTSFNTNQDSSKKENDFDDYEEL
jgi:hypothetical protein